jgi:streptogramin lyase
MRAVWVVAVVPLVVATAAAGLISPPGDARCVTNFDAGFTGGPTHVDLGPDGALWANEGRDDRIARFDTKTGKADEYRVPDGTELHDLAVGPDGNLWFSGFNGPLGTFDLETKKVTVFPRTSPSSQPHLWWAPDGGLYFSDIVKGVLGRFDPKSERIVTRRYNLPKNSGIHGFVEGPEKGKAWWALQFADRLARFDTRAGRFDKFVDLPEGSGPHWLAYVPSDGAIWVALQYANQLARYDLQMEEVTVFDLELGAVTAAQLQARQPLPALTFVTQDVDAEALWLATLAGGEVLRFDLATHELENIGCGLTFPSQTITLASDRAGGLWVTEAPALGGAGSLGRIER